jgi:hypothetical protein
MHFGFFACTLRLTFLLVYNRIPVFFFIVFTSLSKEEGTEGRMEQMRKVEREE